MSTTIDGLVSNLDTTSIIEALVASIKAPANVIQTRVNTTTSKLSAIQALSANVLNVQVAATALRSSSIFSAKGVSSSNNTIVGATASTNAKEGSYTISVQQVATSMQISSDENDVFTSKTTALEMEGGILVNGELVSIKSTDTLSDVAARITNAHAGVTASVIEVRSGEFRLSVRSNNTGESGFTLSNAGSTDILEGLRLVNASSDTIKNSITNGAASDSFSSTTNAVSSLLGLESAVPSGTVTIANGTGSISVAIDLATDSLDDIAAAINSAATAAGSSISASVVQNTSGNYQLEITSGDETAPVFTDASNVLETLGVVASDFTQVDQVGQDALFKVNGMSITRSSNTVTDVIDGVTLSLRSGDSPTTNVTISISSNTSDAVNALQSFVNAYNSVVSFIGTNASYDTETKQAGILIGDSSILNVQSSLSSLLTRSISTLASKDLTSLNSGNGIAKGSIKITDRSGNTATIDLSSAETLQDVLNTINYNTGINVTASINRAGTGIVIQDNSSGGGALSVSEVDGGTTASGLGILGTSYSSTLNGSAIGTAQFLSLAQLGISVNVDGSLAFNSETFTKYLEDNAAAVQAFFTQKGGFAEQAETSLDLLTDSVSGSLTSRASSLEDTITSYEKSIERINSRATAAETRLRAQFTTLEQTLSNLQSQSDYLNMQIEQWKNLYYRD